MLEIYNDMVNDMLGPGNSNLKIQAPSFRNEDSMTRVPDATIVEVERIEDVHRIIDQGTANRHVGATKMNDRSSRSHLIFTVMVERLEESGDVKRGRLHLIDLAGDARVDVWAVRGNSVDKRQRGSKGGGGRGHHERKAERADPARQHGARQHGGACVVTPSSTRTEPESNPIDRSAGGALYRGFVQLGVGKGVGQQNARLSQADTL